MTMMVIVLLMTMMMMMAVPMKMKNNNNKNTFPGSSKSTNRATGKGDNYTNHVPNPQ